MPRQTTSSPYQIFMLGLCFYVLATLAAQTVFQLSENTIAILDTADTAICIAFFLDFIRSVIKAENRPKYLLQ